MLKFQNYAFCWLSKVRTSKQKVLKSIQRELSECVDRNNLDGALERRVGSPVPPYAGVGQGGVGLTGHQAGVVVLLLSP